MARNVSVEKPSPYVRSRWRLLAFLGVALAIGIAYPHLELAWKCRASSIHSEACVWARSYMPLSRWVEPIIITPVVFLLLVLMRKLIGR